MNIKVTKTYLAGDPGIVTTLHQWVEGELDNSNQEEDRSLDPIDRFLGRLAEKLVEKGILTLDEVADCCGHGSHSRKLEHA